MDTKKASNLTLKSCLSAIIIIFILMVVTYILTFIIPSGEYARIIDENGNSVIDYETGFTYVDASFPFYKWLLSPFLVLGADGNTTIIAIILFLFIIGGIMTSLDKSKIMPYMISKIVAKYSKSRYLLIAILTFAFMALGAFVGSFEEVVPLVPILVALAVSLGFDNLTGLGISIIAVGCGFASGVLNPFTVGIAQELAGLPVFSGIWLRIISFILIYILLTGFLLFHCKKVAKDVEIKNQTFERNAQFDKAGNCFFIILGIGIILVISSSFISALRDYTLIIVGLMFLTGGTVACFVSKMKAKDFFSSFLKGIISFLPATLMILMASSIKYILVEAKILDTILYGAVSLAGSVPKWCVILLIYLLALVINFFVPSGSAEAFLLIPLICPIADVFGISRQLCILAYAYGDGFSNVFYPTNPALLLSVGLANVDYGKYAKWEWKFQLANLILTSGVLLFGLAVGYC